MIEPVDLTCEYRRAPLGIDEPHPRFSWRFAGSRRAEVQIGYRVLVSSDRDGLERDQADVWDSGKVVSSRSSLIPYEGAELRPETRYHWKVVVSDADGQPSSSAVEWFETGLMGRPTESGWITLPRPDGSHDGSRPCPYLRRRFTLPSQPAKARVYASALGVYRLFINGSRVGDAQLAPGWTDYRKRIQYQTFDVTDLLLQGSNVIGMVVADGWYSGYLGTAGERELYGSAPAAMLELATDVAEPLVTDLTWEGAFGPHVAADIYRGEIFDSSRSLEGWTDPAHTDGPWEAVMEVDRPEAQLIGSPIEPIRPDEVLPAISSSSPDASRTYFDFGRNVAGWTRLTVDAPQEAVITVRHAEMLEGSELYVENLRMAAATDIYTVAPGERTYEPWFTYHGFRYARVDHPGLDPSAVSAVAVAARTPVEITGSFQCSDPDINALHEAILRSYRSNWLEVPTDCPNRDERLGWTGDATICANTACYLMDAGAFYSKWMQDVEDAKTADGLFTDVAPAVPPWTTRGAPGWGDGGVVVPWMLHRFYGDTRILERHLPSMKRWVDAVWAANLDLLWSREVGDNYGDWLEVGSYTIKEVISTCIFARSASMVADACEAVGDHQGAKVYRDLFDAIGTEFRRAYVRDGRIVGDTQTSYVLALASGVLDEAQRRGAAERLVDLIRDNDGRLTTGFLATEHLLPVLAEWGYIEEAYGLLEARHFPSWLYFIDNGATSMWEHWDSFKPDDGFKNPFMNSFNHCSLGSVARFLYEFVAGITPVEPGFRRFKVHPMPGGSLTSVEVTFRSIAGLIGSGWRRSEGRLEVDVQVPAGTSAEIVLPDGRVTESGGPLEEAEGLLSVDRSGQQTLVTVGSGNYRFSVDS